MTVGKCLEGNGKQPLILGEMKIRMRISRLALMVIMNNYQQSSYWLRDGSYLRLKTLDIGYTFPKAWVNKIHLNQVRVFFIGQLADILSV